MSSLSPHLSVGVDDLVLIHMRAMESSGRQPAVVDEGRPLLVAVIGTAQEATRTLGSIAVLVHGIARTQAFGAGNRRTALAVAAVYLDRIGRILDADLADELAEMLTTASVEEPNSPAVSEIEKLLRRSGRRLSDEAIVPATRD